MRRVFICVLALSAACLSAGAQSAEDRIAACVDDLRLPTIYPPLGSQARIESVVVAEVTAPSEGEAPTINFLAGHRLFDIVLERPLLESTYNPACAGERLLFQFKFTLDGPLVNVTEVTQEAPGLISVRSRAHDGPICILLPGPGRSRLERWASKTGRVVSSLARAF